MTDLSAYRPFWHPIAHVGEIGEKPKALRLLGERLVAFRTADGISVFKDLCIHRGSALSLGRVIEGAIECPYHGWRYDSTGRCVRIPALKPEDPIPARARAIAYPVRIMADLVWVALEEPEAPFPDYPPDWAWGQPHLRSCYVGAYDWAVDAGRAVENFLDVAHFPFVHEGSLGDRSNTVVEPHEVEQERYALRFVYDQVEPGDPSTGHAETMRLIYYYRAPFTVHLKRQTEHQAWSCMSLYASPVSATESRLFVTFVRSFDLEPEKDGPLLAFMELIMNEDKAVVSSVRPEEIPVDLREELHVKVPDRAGVAFRRILAGIENPERLVA